MNRRGFLKIAGGGVILAAGSAGLFAATRTPKQALAPWQLAGGYDDPRMRALSHAVLAPNPHNRQPWIVRLEGMETVFLYFDTDRQLPHTDPFDRQLTIGLGCFLELMEMAAAADGYTTDVSLFPEGMDPLHLDDRPVAKIEFRKSSQAAPDALWLHVMSRRSNKEPFDTSKRVPADAMKRALEFVRHGQAGGSVAEADIAYWRDLSERALQIEIDTPNTYRESVDLFRIGKSEVNRDPDGIDFSGATFDILKTTGLFSRETALDKTSMAYKQGEKAVLDNCRTAMGHVWLVTEDNSRETQIRTGADWLRLNLALTSEGLAFQPLSQALQEYPEMSDLYDETHARLAPDGGTVQMLGRIGYGPDVAPSPRWPLDAKVKAA